MCAVSADAATVRWKRILSISLVIGFDGDEATAAGIAQKKSTASKIDGALYLYELVGDRWVYIGEWRQSKARGTLGVEGRSTAREARHIKPSLLLRHIPDSVPETEVYERIKVCPRYGGRGIPRAHPRRYAQIITVTTERKER